MRCSWVHCGASFEGRSPPGWRLVARQLSTGEQVVVCPEHALEAGEADLRALLKLFQRPEVPSLASPEDRAEQTRRLGRPLK